MISTNISGVYFVNLTPHAIVVNTAKSPVAIPPSGELARVKQEFVNVGDDGDFIKTVTSEFGEVEGLPAPQKDTVFIVSSIVASATDRTDIAIPNTADAVRDEQGRIQSVRSLIVRKDIFAETREYRIL